MKAVTVQPGIAGSARYEEVPEPDERSGSILVEAVAVGICGTDVEIASGAYGWSPPGRDRLVLGHESLGRVVDPGGSGLNPGDLVVGIVRRPDPVPCPNCAVGEWDMCRNGHRGRAGAAAGARRRGARGAPSARPRRPCCRARRGAMTAAAGQPGAAVACTTEQNVLGEGPAGTPARRAAAGRHRGRTGLPRPGRRRRRAAARARLPAARHGRRDRPHRGRRRLAAGRQPGLHPPGARRRPPGDRRGVTGGHPDERRRLRPPGPCLGRRAGRRPPRRRRRALPAGRRRAHRADARRPDDPQRDRLEPGRRHDVPRRQRAARHPRLRFRRRAGDRLRTDGSWSPCPRRSARRTA